MSQETEKLDALVSSMEQDWCAHYKPDALGEDLSSIAPKESAPAALEAEPAETIPPLATKPVDTDLETVAPMHDDALLLDAEDMKLLDQLSESDWDALDDDAIEALAKQLLKRISPSLKMGSQKKKAMKPSMVPPLSLLSRTPQLCRWMRMYCQLYRPRI